MPSNGLAKVEELEPDNFGALVQMIKSLDAADLRLEAREMAVKKLEELEKDGLTTDRKTYDMLVLVVTTVDSEFETQEMEHWVFRLWELTKQMFPEQSAEMLLVYNFLGSFYMNKQMFEESEKYYLKAMDARENCTGEALREANLTLNNLGLLYCNLQRYQEALPLLERAIQVHDEEFGEGHPGSIYSRINYAHALFCSGKHELAMQKYLQIKDLVIEKVGKDHDMYFKVLQHLSGICTELQRYAEAEHYLRENLELQISRKDDRTFEVAVLLRGLGQVLSRINKLDEAEECLRRSVEIFKEVAPPESLQAIIARKSLTQINLNRGNLAEALSELLDLIEIIRRIGSDPYGLLENFQDLVLKIYTKQESWEEAEKFLSRVLSGYKGKATDSSAYVKFKAKYVEVLKILGR